jgi:hypothetical protein
MTTNPKSHSSSSIAICPCCDITHDTDTHDTDTHDPATNDPMIRMTSP